MVRQINSNKINCERSVEDIIYKDVTFCIEQHNRAIEFVFFISQSKNCLIKQSTYLRDLYF